MADIDNFENGMTEEEMAALEEENRQPVNPEAPKEEDTTAKPESAEETETPSAAPTEQKTDEEATGSDPENPPKVEVKDGDETPDDPKKPWHTHPRWIARENKMKALEKELEEQKAWRESVESRLAPAPADDDAVLEIPDWFAELYGSEDPEKDQQVYKRYLSARKAEEDQIVERVTGRVAAEQTQQTEQEKADLEWVDSELSAVRESMQDGDPAFEDNELLKVIKDFRPMKEEDGQLVPDFGAAYDILKMQKSKAPATPEPPKPKQPTQQKKDLAAHVPSAVSEPGTETVASNESLALDPPW